MASGERERGAGIGNHGRDFPGEIHRDSRRDRSRAAQHPEKSWNSRSFPGKGLLGRAKPWIWGCRDIGGGLGKAGKHSRLIQEFPGFPPCFIPGSREIQHPPAHAALPGGLSLGKRDFPWKNGAGNSPLAGTRLIPIPTASSSRFPWKAHPNFHRILIPIPTPS